MFQIIWKSYNDNLPNFYTNGEDMWEMISPLICFYIGDIW